MTWLLSPLTLLILTRPCTYWISIDLIALVTDNFNSCLSYLEILIESWRRTWLAIFENWVEKVYKAKSVILRKKLDGGSVSKNPSNASCYWKEGFEYISWHAIPYCENQNQNQNQNQRVPPHPQKVLCASCRAGQQGILRTCDAAERYGISWAVRRCGVDWFLRTWRIPMLKTHFCVNITREQGIAGLSCSRHKVFKTVDVCDECLFSVPSEVEPQNIFLLESWCLRWQSWHINSLETNENNHWNEFKDSRSIDTQKSIDTLRREYQAYNGGYKNCEHSLAPLGCHKGAYSCGILLICGRALPTFWTKLWFEKDASKKGNTRKIFTIKAEKTKSKRKTQETKSMDVSRAGNALHPSPQRPRTYWATTTSKAQLAGNIQGNLHVKILTSGKTCLLNFPIPTPWTRESMQEPYIKVWRISLAISPSPIANIVLRSLLLPSYWLARSFSFVRPLKVTANSCKQ